MAVATSRSTYRCTISIPVPPGVGVDEAVLILGNRDLYPTGPDVPDFEVLGVNLMKREITVGHSSPGGGPKLQNSLPGHIYISAQELTD